MNTNQFNNIHDPIARAEAMRAQVVADLLIDAINGLTDLVKSAAAKLVAYREFRRTYDALSAMTDRELDDIGIHRSDIVAVAHGADPRPQREAAVGDALAQRLVLATVFGKEEEVRKPAAVQGDDHRTAAAA